MMRKKSFFKIITAVVMTALCMNGTAFAEFDETAELMATTVYFYDNSMLPNYKNVTGATSIAAGLGFPASNATVSRYFYYSDEGQKNTYEEFLLYYGWIKEDAAEGTDTNGKYRRTKYSKIDKFDNVSIAEVNIYYYYEKEEVDILFALNNKKLPTLTGDYKNKGSFTKSIWYGRLEYAIADTSFKGLGLKMMIAEYDDNGALLNLTEGTTLEVSNGVRLIVDIPSEPSNGNYKLFIWDGEGKPLVNYISGF